MNIENLPVAWAQYRRSRRPRASPLFSHPEQAERAARSRRRERRAMFDEGNTARFTGVLCWRREGQRGAGKRRRKIGRNVDAQDLACIVDRRCCVRHSGAQAQQAPAPAPARRTGGGPCPDTGSDAVRRALWGADRSREGPEAIAAAIAEASKSPRNWKLAIAVVDPNGDLVALAEDGSNAGRLDRHRDRQSPNRGTLPPCLRGFCQRDGESGRRRPDDTRPAARLPPSAAIRWSRVARSSARSAARARRARRTE